MRIRFLYPNENAGHSKRIIITRREEDGVNGQRLKQDELAACELEQRSQIPWYYILRAVLHAVILKTQRKETVDTKVAQRVIE